NALLEKYGDLPKGMIEIKGGSFKMGGDGESDEKPIHNVDLNSFYIGKYEVTQSEYKSIMGKNPSSFLGDNLPVENISWWDAIKYCNKKSLSEKLPVAYNETNGQLLDSNGNITSDITKVVGYRLPTEAEWEYASRGGNKSKGYKYSGSNLSEEVSWYGYEKIDKKTHPIGTKKSNELGLFDMSGNVSEWVYDTYISDAYRKIKDNKNPYFTSLKPTDYRVYRGGSWNYIEMHQSVFNRSGYIPEYKGENIGLRIARSILEE
ncbi:MAG: formylglycine-generating enzyme family protein, partial [Candidatus Sericytochromatia bacterium]